MTGLLEASLYSKHLGTIAGQLAEDPESLGIELRLSVVAALLRGVQVQEPSVCRMNAFGSPSPPPMISFLPSTLTLPLYDLISLLQPPASLPSTPPPKRKSPSQDVLGLVAISPPTAVLRSPAVTGLTKTYTRNDFPLMQMAKAWPRLEELYISR
ncbi:hypothetical protein P692DRAFT_20870911 [Suillus brevipes Sb2]|nr:hypothetical protein P692DRAFT_20870911 [Suillus brevipes Sb2]